ncbi:ABC transporter ATP-binding protein [Lacticaseibacillus pantheris]|jgi:ATP-binding cassette subfamily B multidrug efflux pump
MQSDFKVAGRYFGHYLGRYPWQLILSVVTVAIYCGAAVYTPILLGNAVTQLTTVLADFNAHHAVDTAPFIHTAATMIVINVLAGFADGATSAILGWVSGVATSRMRSDLFAKMQRIGISYYDRTEDGDLLARFTSDLDNIFNAMNQAFINSFYCFGSLIGVLIMMFTSNVMMGFVTIITTPLAVLVSWLVITHASRAVNEQQRAVGALNGYINEQITGQKVIITNGLQQQSIDGFTGRNATVLQAAQRGQIWAGMLMPVMSGLMLLNTAIVIFFGSWYVLQGSMALGTGLAVVAVFVQYAQQYYQPIIQMTSMYNIIQQAVTGARRVSEVFEQPDEVRPEGGKVIDGVRKGVAMTDVHFGYLPGIEILHGININAPRGNMVALVGPTGSGKTTVMNLLNRFYDVGAGSITIDGTDIRDIDLTSLRNNVGIVLQDPQLFSGTIRDNIRFGRPEAGDDAVQNAAQQARIHDYIMSLPDGYDTLITDEQSVFSAGQKQLLSIARTILTDPPVMIMDEATSNVDTVTEAQLQAAMNAVTQGRTSFLIAHRLRTIVHADEIDVLRHGTIIERGTHADLMAANGFYAQLYRDQMPEL